ncbi:unnamed protein product [Orchesella dallaii]|uniref:Gustatory receptor n=1 Tax=Orchesella dallaii TaxID=48710 RepID=A0ABP1RK67_9HEXA
MDFQVENHVIRLYYQTFSYMYQFPIHWDFKSSKGSVIKEKWRTIPWHIVQFGLITGIGTMSILYVLLRQLITPSKLKMDHMSVFQLHQLVSVLIIHLGCAGIGYVLWRDAEIVAAAFNAFTFFTPYIKRRFRREWKEMSRRRTEGSILSTTGIVMMGSLGHTITMWILYKNIDPYWHIFREVFWHLEDWSVAQICAQQAFRYIAVILSITEILRTVSFVGTFGSIIILRLIKTIQTMHESEDYSGVFHVYRVLRILYRNFDRTISDVAVITMTCGHGATLALIWMVVKMSSRLSIPFYSMLVMGMTYFIVFSVIFLSKSVQVGILSKELADKLRLIPLEGIYFNKKYCRKRARAMRPFAIKVGRFFDMDRRTPLTYLSVLMTNAANSVLLIDI